MWNAEESFVIGVAQIISRCWKADPNVRPTFANPEHMLGGWMEESVRTTSIWTILTTVATQKDGSLVDEFMSLESSTNQQQSTSAAYVNVQQEVWGHYNKVGLAYF